MRTTMPTTSTRLERPVGDPVPGGGRVVGGHRLAAVMALVAAVTAAACGGSATSSASSAPSIVTAPAFSLQGCTYIVNNSIPAGEPHGIQPTVTPFTANAAATTALTSIRRHGGTAMVDGTGVPAGTELFAGPDTTGTPVLTVPSGHAVIVAEPLVWRDTRSGLWLAFFIACGGPQLYWASVRVITKADPSAGASVSTLVQQLSQAAPYTRSDRASLLPVVISGGRLTWADPTVKLAVGRGSLIQSP